MVAKKWRILLLVLVLMSLVLMNVSTASATGWCVSGYKYGGGGTGHNYVEFQVNFSARNWHIEKPWWALPADLWAYPNFQGIAQAGIRGTDWDPPYSPSHYKLCGTM